MGATGLEPVTPSVSKWSYTSQSFAVLPVKNQSFHPILGPDGPFASLRKLSQENANLCIERGNFPGTFRETVVDRQDSVRVVREGRLGNLAASSTTASCDDSTGPPAP